MFENGSGRRARRHLQMRSYDRVHCHQQKALCYILHLGGSRLYTAGKKVALIYSLEEHQRTQPSILMNGLQCTV